MQSNANRITVTPGLALGILTFSCLVSALLIFVLYGQQVLGANLTFTQTTLSDFNSGFFYHTGLTQQTAGGGDGDGEVRLLALGISAASWYSDGNTSGLAGLQGHAAAQKNGHIYLSGGTPGGLSSSSTAVSYTTILSANHNLANWTGTTPLPDPRQDHSMLEVNNYIYVIGGLDSTIQQTNTVYVALINPNGSLGAWTSTTPLPGPRAHFAGAVVSGTIYVLGGSTLDVVTNTVFYATPNPVTGAVSTWMTATARLPNPTSRQAATSYKGAIYEFGGSDFPNNSFYPNVYYGIPESSGDILTWTSTVNLPGNLDFASSVAFAGQVYVVGGATNNEQTVTNTIATNLVNPDGTLLQGGWTSSNVLSAGRQRSASVLSDDGWLYVIEGNPGNNLQPLHTIDYGPTTGAGATKYASSGDFVSSVIDLGTARRLLDFQWNATVTDTTKVSLTLEYRSGSSSNLGSQPWTRLGDSAPGTVLTNTVPVTATARFVQYHAIFSSRQDDLTPVLNRVQITYSTGAPDLIITNISYPVHIEAGQTLTTTVYVMNQGTEPACPPLVGNVRSPNILQPGSVREGPAQTGCFFRIDLYIDRSPPVSFTDLGNCQVGASPSFGIFNSLTNGTLGARQIAVIQIPCAFSTGNPHTFYAMADSCDSPGPGSCSSIYGWIPESDESNNVFGPAISGPKNQFIPLLGR